MREEAKIVVTIYLYPEQITREEAERALELEFEAKKRDALAQLQEWFT